MPAATGLVPRTLLRGVRVARAFLLPSALLKMGCWAWLLLTGGLKAAHICCCLDRDRSIYISTCLSICLSATVVRCKSPPPAFVSAGLRCCPAGRPSPLRSTAVRCRRSGNSSCTVPLPAPRRGPLCRTSSQACTDKCWRGGIKAADDSGTQADT